MLRRFRTNIVDRLDSRPDALSLWALNGRRDRGRCDDQREQDGTDGK